jgi:hydrogenase maturation protease
MTYPSATTAATLRHSRILAVGLGNSILRDDGVGVHAVRRFQQITPRPCLAVEVGTAVFNAAHLLETADRILAFDAVKTGGKPGSVYVLRAEDVLEEGEHGSLHEMGLIQVLKTLHRPPAEVVIIGAEPQIIDWGLELSPVLDAAVPLMVSTAQRVVEYFNATSSPGVGGSDATQLARYLPEARLCGVGI